MMKLKTERFNSWEWNIPVSDLHGYIYVADHEDGGLVMMSEVELSNGNIVDVEIIGISDDLETVTVSTATRFGWGEHCCFSYSSMREAYLHYITGKAA